MTGKILHVTQLVVLLLLLESSFLCVLACYEYPPKLALTKLSRRFRRFLKGPMRLPPTLADFPYDKNDFPYRRVKGSRNRLHKPLVINLETSDGTGQACHPDIAYLPEGFGPERWRYWLACTPYPYQNYMLENPEIFASHDGITWVIPDGLKNPVVPPPANPFDYHSDTDILFHQGELWLFFRETKRGDVPRQTTLFAMTSSDGIQWSSPAELFCDKNNLEPMSPAVIHDGCCFRMWTIEIHDGDYRIVLRNSKDGLHWNPPRFGKLVGLDPQRHAWHIDVIQEKDRLSALLVSSVGTPSTGERLHYCHSMDGGNTWNVGPFLLEQIYEFEEMSQYRGTLRKMTDNPHLYEVWYSAFNKTAVASIARLRMIRVENELFPHCDRMQPTLG